MGRIREDIRIGKENHWTLFDSGARHSYIVKSIAEQLPFYNEMNSTDVRLGGQIHSITHNCGVHSYIQDLSVDFMAWVLDEIGEDEDGKEIEVLIGAIVMQQWGIKLDIPNEKLDMSLYPKEFLEFVGAGKPKGE